MRVLITLIGDQEVKNIAHSNLDNKKKTQKKITKQLTRRFTRNTTLNDKVLKTIKSVPIKEVSINQKKGNIPAYILEKYTDPNETINTSILPDIFLNIENNRVDNQYSLAKSSNVELPVVQESYQIKDIIPKKVFAKLNKHIKNSELMKIKNFKMNESNYRSNISPHKTSDLQKLKIKEISSDNVNLIEYLNGKTTITEHFLKEISSHSEERLKKLNKICQIVLYNKQQEKLFSHLLKNKMEAKNIKTQNDYKEGLKTMEKRLMQYNLILKRNERPPEDKENYTYLHREIQQKYWSKLKLNRIDRSIQLSESSKQNLTHNKSSYTSDKNSTII